MTRKMTSKQFRAALETLGLSQSGAAERLGLGLRTVHGYANGDTIPEAVRLALEYLKGAQSVPNNKHSHSSQ